MADRTFSPPFSLIDFCFHCGNVFEDKDVLRLHLHRAYHLNCPEAIAGQRCWICDIYIHNRDPVLNSGPFEQDTFTHMPTRDFAPVTVVVEDEFFPQNLLPFPLGGEDPDPNPDALQYMRGGASPPVATINPERLAPMSDTRKRELVTALRRMTDSEMVVVRNMIARHGDLRHFRDTNGSLNINLLPTEAQWELLDYVRVVLGRQRQGQIQRSRTPPMGQTAFPAAMGAPAASHVPKTALPYGVRRDDAPVQGSTGAAPASPAHGQKLEKTSVATAPEQKLPRRLYTHHELPPLSPATEEELRKIREGFRQPSRMQQVKPRMSPPNPNTAHLYGRPASSLLVNVAMPRRDSAVPERRSDGPRSSPTMSRSSVGFSGIMAGSAETYQRMLQAQLLRQQDQFNRQMAERRATAMGFAGGQSSPPMAPSHQTQRVGRSQDTHGTLHGNTPAGSAMQSNGHQPAEHLAAARYTLGQEQGKLLQPSSTAPRAMQYRGLALDPALMVDTVPMTTSGGFQQGMQSGVARQTTPGMPYPNGLNSVDMRSVPNRTHAAAPATMQMPGKRAAEEDPGLDSAKRPRNE